MLPEETIQSDWIITYFSHLLPETKIGLETLMLEKRTFLSWGIRPLDRCQLLDVKVIFIELDHPFKHDTKEIPSNLPYHRYTCIIWFLPKWINIHSLKLTVCPWTLAIPNEKKIIFQPIHFIFPNSHGTSNITGWLFDFWCRPKWVFYDFLWHLHCFHLFLTLQHHGANTFGPDDAMIRWVFFHAASWFIMGPWLFRGCVGDEKLPSHRAGL